MNTTLKAALWAALLVTFSGLGPLMGLLFTFSETDLYLLQGGLLLLSLAIPFTQLSKGGAHPADIGVQPPKQGSAPAVLYYLPALVAELPLLLMGVSIAGMGVLLAQCFFLLTAGFVEEIFCRGVIYNVLKGGCGVRRAILVSALIFGFCHLPSALLNGNLFLIIKSALFGVIAAELRAHTGSIYPAIAYHTGYNLIAALIAPENVLRLPTLIPLVITTVHIAAMLFYAVYLWKRLPAQPQ